MSTKGWRLTARVGLVVTFGALAVLMLLAQDSFSQTAEQAKAGAAKRGRIFLTKKEILEGAKKEGRLVAVPGFDEASFPLMKKAFENSYPFLKVDLQVATGAGSERRHYDLVSGVADVDVFSPSHSRWSDYEKYNVLAKYDLQAMVKAGELKIHPDMIDTAAPTPGLFGEFSSRIDVLLYNAKLVPSEAAPKNWESCLDPKWKGKFSVDTRYSGFRYLVAAWPEEKVMDFARKVKENNPIWVQGMTATITRLAAGEIHWMCSAFLHSALRLLGRDPTLPIKIVFPSPTVVAMSDGAGIYAKARHPHAGLLWIEWLASLEAQNALSQRDPGKASFLVEGTVPNRLLKDAKVKTVLCRGDCVARAAVLEERIAIEAWDFPSVKKRR